MLDPQSTLRFSPALSQRFSDAAQTLKAPLSRPALSTRLSQQVMKLFCPALRHPT